MELHTPGMASLLVCGKTASQQPRGCPEVELTPPALRFEGSRRLAHRTMVYSYTASQSPLCSTRQWANTR
jgi:hypothetical protein